MVVTFYNYVGDPRVLDKALGTSTGSATGVLHERVSDTKLSIKMPSTVFNVLTQSNYCMIDTFGKYYYLDPFEVENDCVIVNMHEDVRKTFAAQIKAMPATIDRNEYQKQGYLNDSGYNAMAYQGVQYKHFPNGLTDASYILVTVG